MPAFTLTTAFRAELRAQAHALKPVVMIGADGLTEPVMAEAERAIAFHQLIKVRVLGDEREHRLDIANTLVERLDATLVQHIGKLLVFYRAAPDVKKAANAAPAKGRAAGPTANAALARRSTATPAAKSGRAASPASAARSPARAPAVKTSRKRATTDFATAAPRERAKARDAGDIDTAVRPPRTGKGAAPRMVTVVKPTGNDRRRARPTEVLVRGNERVTAGGNVKRAKKRVTSVKRMQQG